MRHLGHLTWRAWCAAALMAVTATAFAQTSQSTWQSPQWDAVVAGELPAGLRDQRSEGVEVRYTRSVGASGQSVLRIQIKNTSDSKHGYYVLFFGDRLALKAGSSLRLQTRLSLESDGFQGSMSLGYHVFDVAGNYLTEGSGPEGIGDVFRTDVQDLKMEYMAGTPRGGVGGPVQQMTPRLSVSSLAPRSSLVIKLALLSRQVVDLPAMGIMAGQAPKSAWPGKVVRVSVPLVLGRPWSAGGNTRLKALDSQGRVVWSDSRPWPSEWRTRTGLIRDVWTVSLPKPEGGLSGALQWWYQATDKEGRNAPFKPVGAAAPAEKSGEWRVAQTAMDPQSGMLLGSAFHHYPASKIADSEAAIGGVRLKYDFARSLGNDHGMVPWWTDGGKSPSMKLRRLDWWADYFSKPGQKSLLLVFTGTDTEASSQPGNRNNPLRMPGLSAMPRSLDQLTQAVVASLKHYSGRVRAVECWNEPTVPEFFSGSMEDVANHCKAVAKGVRQQDPTVPVICPQVPAPESMGYVLQAKTSAGERLTDFCDYVGAHMYRGTVANALDEPTSAMSMEEELGLMRARLTAAGINKPIAVTEYGIDRCVTPPDRGAPSLDSLSDAQKARLVYDGLATMAQYDVRFVALYSYDLGGEPNACAMGGYLWMTNERFTKVNEVVLKRVNEAYEDFGVLRGKP